MAHLRRMVILLVAALFAAVSPSPVVAYEAGAVLDGGTITGKVVFRGDVPTRKIIPTKDRDVCGFSTRERPEIVVGADKGVQDAVVYLKKLEKGKAWEKPAKTPEIVSKDCEYVPHVQAIPAGSIAMVNLDPVLHNNHGFLGKTTLFNQALPMQGQRIEKPLKKEGLMRVECDAHGWMLAWIYVAGNPYYAVTRKDGRFSISEVPPGSYTLVAWQNYTGEIEVPVTIKPKEAVQVAIELKK